MPPPLRSLDEDAALRSILEGTATETGESFFAALVRNLARSLCTHGAWVTEHLEESGHLRSLAFWLGGRFIPNLTMEVAGTPCEAVLTEDRLVLITDNVLERYPVATDFGARRVDSQVFERQLEDVPVVELDDEQPGFPS